MISTQFHGTQIQLEACAKTFDNTQVLEPFTLEIKGGETIVLLGPSGCGKTTLLRIIAGLEEVDKGGKILFDGEDVTSLPIEKRNIGMVFQSYALFPNMNVRDNIAYGLKVQKMKKEQIVIRVNEMLEMMNITNLANRRINQLSGGQCQRVALARAIATYPRVLLLDEPLSALDALLRNNLRVEINSLLKRLGITAIYVTHDQEEAMELGDRIVVMNNGKVSQIGTPTELYHQPSNNFTAEFIGTINRFRGKFNSGLLNIDGHQFSHSSSSLKDESHVDVLFRPEDVIISDSKDTPFKGVLKNSLFLGNRTKLIVDMQSEREVVIETDNHNIYSVGQEINFTINESFLILMPKEGQI